MDRNRGSLDSDRGFHAGYISGEVSQGSRFTPRMINTRLVTVSDGSGRERKSENGIEFTRSR